jgi:hypothetical protein
LANNVKMAAPPFVEPSPHTINWANCWKGLLRFASRPHFRIADIVGVADGWTCREWPRADCALDRLAASPPNASDALYTAFAKEWSSDIPRGRSQCPATSAALCGPKLDDIVGSWTKRGAEDAARFSREVERCSSALFREGADYKFQRVRINSGRRRGQFSWVSKCRLAWSWRARPARAFPLCP